MFSNVYSKLWKWLEKEIELMAMSGRSRIDDIRGKSKKWKSDELFEYQKVYPGWPYDTRLKYYGIFVLGISLLITLFLVVYSIFS